MTHFDQQEQLYRLADEMKTLADELSSKGENLTVKDKELIRLATSHHIKTLTNELIYFYMMGEKDDADEVIMTISEIIEKTI